MGLRTTASGIAQQLATAMMPSLSRTSSGFTSGTTSGTFSFIRQAELLSTTSAPASTATGARASAMSAPAEKSARSTSSKELSSRASIWSRAPLKGNSRPAERSEASALTRPTGNRRCASTRSISCPTIPVAPTTATLKRRLGADIRVSLVGPAQPQQIVQAAVEALLRGHLPDRQQHPRRVGLAAGGAVGDGQRLAGQPEDDLLVGDQPRQPHRVHGHRRLLPTSGALQGHLLGPVVAEPLPGAQPARGGERGAGGRVDLARVVHLDHLGRLEEGSRQLGQVHHQDRAHREVGGHHPPHSRLPAGGLQLVDFCRRQPGGADHGRDPGPGRRHRVSEDGARVREVDQHRGPVLFHEPRHLGAPAEAAHVLDALRLLEERLQGAADLAGAPGQAHANQDVRTLAAYRKSRRGGRPPPLRPPRPRSPPRSRPRSRPPNPPPSRGGGGGEARAAAMASRSIFSSIGSPLACSSSMAACRLRLRRPWLSISTALTTISSPTLTTSSTRSTRWSVSFEMWTRPSWLGSTSTKAPKGMMRTTFPL